MKTTFYVCGSFSLAVALMAAAIGSVGCSKKQDANVAAGSAAPETQSASASPQTPAAPVLDASQMGDAKAAMAEADAALRQGEYEKAVKTMLALQQAQLNAQQTAAMEQQMIALQRNLAKAIASG